MKLIFSLASALVLGLFFASECYARDFILITHDSNLKFKKKVEKIILKKLKIPAKYLAWKQKTNPCEKVTEGTPILHLCLDKGEVKVIKSSPEILKRTIAKIMTSEEQNEREPSRTF